MRRIIQCLIAGLLGVVLVFPVQAQVSNSTSAVESEPASQQGEAVSSEPASPTSAGQAGQAEQAPLPLKEKIREKIPFRSVSPERKEDLKKLQQGRNVLPQIPERREEIVPKKEILREPPVRRLAPGVPQQGREVRALHRLPEEKIKILRKKRQEQMKTYLQIIEKRKKQEEEMREKMREKIKVIREERKRKIVEGIYDRLNALNKRLMGHFEAVLSKIEVVLGRIESRTNKAEQRGLDVSKVREKIELAKQAIESSRSAVKAQLEKVYSFDIESETTLRQNIGEARRALHSDLVEVRKTVMAAYRAVKEAAVALAQVPRVDQLETQSSQASAISSESESQ